MLRAVAGLAAVAALKLLGIFPPDFIVVLGTPWLPFYALGRGHSSSYYRMRLRIAALSLRHLTGHWNDMPVHIEGEELYRAALETGKPVALLGWHQGPVELLHRLPPSPADGRPFFIATAEGFAPALTRLLREGRDQPNKQTIGREGFPAALRKWARQRGVLAVMVDQVPGKPGDWLSLWNDKVKIPFPRDLLDWLHRRDAVFLAVSARLNDENSIAFRYEPVHPDCGDLQKQMETALNAASDQYNWSYPKIKINV